MEIITDKETALEKVSEDGLALLYVAKDLKDDNEIVMAAMKNCGLALRYAFLLF